MITLNKNGLIARHTSMNLHMMWSYCTHYSINCHVQNPARSHYVEESINVLKNGHHHFIFIFWCWPGGYLAKFNHLKRKSYERLRLFAELHDTYLSSGCVHGWIIPFISKYKLSNSTSFGLGLLVSTGIRTPLHSLDCNRDETNSKS